MSLIESVYQKNPDSFLKIFLEIDQHKELIIDFFYQGPLVDENRSELEELKEKVLNKPIDEILLFKQSDLNCLKNSEKIHSLGIWLIHRAVDNFRGRDEVIHPSNKNLCLCYGVSLDEFEKTISSNPEIDLDQLIKLTKVTSACGGCKNIIIKKLDFYHNSIRRKLDSQGRWITVKGLYPAELVLLLDESLKRWIEIQAIAPKLNAEIMEIEGFHIDMKFTDENGINLSNPEILISLKQFWLKEHDLDLFLHFFT
jgi:bacterioferritin-associated ferredoxin